jgi:S-adenosyl methyltransferase
VVSDGASRPSDDDRELYEVDPTVARPARIRDYLSGGECNFAPDREVAEHLSAALPGGLEAARATVRALTDFTARAVQYLVTDAGVRQFLHIGASIPRASEANEVHDIAQDLAPESRVVYVGSDPMVLAHAHRLRRSTDAGAIDYIHGTLRDPPAIMRQAATTLDLDQPVAVMLLVTLNFVADADHPAGIVARLLDAVPSGSYLVIAHTTNDIPAEGVAEAAKRLSDLLQEPYVVRTHAEIAGFFDRLDLVEPGLVQIAEWHPPGDRPVTDAERQIPMYAGLGRKP